MFLVNEKVSLDILKAFCKKARLKQTKTKKQLLIDYNQYLATRKIQRGFRKYLYHETVDPITLDQVNFPCFIYRTKFGKCHFYAYNSIIKYIMKTGFTKDPMTREEYSGDVLKRLDTQVKIYFPMIKYPSTYRIKISEVYARRVRNRENEIIHYQNRIVQLKGYILFIIESGMESCPNESIYIENVEYQNVQLFIDRSFHELKMILGYLRIHDTQSVELFKTQLLQETPESFISLIQQL